MIFPPPDQKGTWLYSSTIINRCLTGKTINTCKTTPFPQITFKELRRQLFVGGERKNSGLQNHFAATSTTLLY